MMSEPALILTAFGAAVFLWRRLLVFLHITQQEEYHPARTLRWWMSRFAFDRRATVTIGAAALLGLAWPAFTAWIAAGTGAALALLGVLETDPRTSAKKRLVMTKRATRIHRLAFGLTLPVLAGVAWWGEILSFVIVFQAAPLFIVAAIWLLSPIEKNVAEGFQQEAVDKITRLDPMVVAITGSFGKTSVKHILGHILEARDRTLITPGSVNAPLGVTRIIRERLTPKHVYFVAEMGAYGVGSIRRVCRVAPPKLSMLTTIGPAHYERFKSLEEVARAKIEIAEEAIANGGRFIVPASLTEYEAVQRFVAQHLDKVVLTGAGQKYELISAGLTPHGVALEVRVDGTQTMLAAPIYGTHQAENVFMAAVAAMEVGMPLEDVAAALPSVPQIRHRCEVKRAPGAATIIDDSYNSNPSGFLSALDVLDALKVEGGRRIVVTPGMVELGALHDAEHERLGKAIAERADLLVAVAPQRAPTLISGFQSVAQDLERLMTFERFSEARTWIDSQLTAKDTVLIENDLPDIYEMRVSL